MDATMKFLSLEHGVYNAMLWRIVFGMAIIGTIYLSGRPQKPSTKTLGLHVKRGFLTLVMASLFFWGLTQIPLAQAVGLSFIAPIVALFLAAWLINEPVIPNDYIASIIALVGVGVLLLEELAKFETQSLRGSGAVLLSAVMYAYNLILQRQQALVAQPLEISFYQTLVTFIGLALVAPWWAEPLPDLRAGVLAATAASLALGALICLSFAYRHAVTASLVTLEYTAFIWAAALGWFIFSEAISINTLGGTALIVAACIFQIRGVGKRTTPK
jgi:S-adenosylmethionine uptake transporter